MIQVSNSELRAAQWCRRHWYLAYYLALTPRHERDRPVGEAKLGTRVHAALELWYGSGLDPRRVLYELYGEARGAWPDPEDVTRLDQEYDLALAMVEGYVDWVEETGADEGLELIAPEQEVVVESALPSVLFRGKLDQRIRRASDGARLFLDHKTVGSFENAVVILHMDPQMRFYSMLEALDAHRNGGARVDGGLYNMLRRSKRTARAKPPFYQRLEVRYNRHELRATWRRANAVARDIWQWRLVLRENRTNHHEVVPPNPNRDCVWRCQFVRVCPLMDDGSRWQEMLEAQFTVHDPYDYYRNEAAERIRDRLLVEGAQ